MHTVQLDFQDAKTKHLQFKSRLRSILFGEILEDENPVLSHTECPVGKWIYNHALFTYHNIPELRDLEKVHQQIHLIARELINLYKEGKIEQSRAGLFEMESVADDLILLLEKVETKIPQQNENEISDGNIGLLSEMYQKNEALYIKIKSQSEEITKQEEFYKNLLVASPVVLWMSDENTKITYTSPTWYLWTGFKEEEEIGAKWMATIYEGDKEKVVQVYNSNFVTRSAFEVEYRMHIKEKLIWCLKTGQPVFDKSQNFIGYVGSITNISERKKAEEEINRKREDERKLLYGFFMEAPAIFCVLRGPEHIFEIANPLYLELVGNRNITGKTVRDALPELAGQGFFELLDDVYKNQKKFIGKELPVSIDRGKGPEDLAITFIYQPIVNSFNETDGILVYANDVTEQVNVREILQSSEEKFKRMADMSPQIIWTAKPDGKVEYFNERWYDFTGYDRSLGNESWDTILHPDDAENTLKIWNHAVTTGTEYNVEYRFKDRNTNNYRWFLGKALPFKNDDGQITQWFGTCTDIQDQKNFSAELEKKVAERTQQLVDLNVDLKRSNEELSQFAYIASHDLQEPLRKIMTFSNRVNEKYKEDLPKGSNDYLLKINNSAKRMSMLINDLLEFSGTNRHNKEFIPTDLNTILQHLLEDFEEEIDIKNAKIIFDKLPVVSAIPLQMTQLFHNLISNALKFSKKDVDPVITIASQKMTVEQKEKYDVPEKNAEYIQISFCDNGIGFEQNFSDKIFIIFQRLHNKSAYEGTGIGLALCKKIAENHAGNIIAESANNMGTCFYINLPYKNNY